MSEKSKPLLSELQEAWQTLQNEIIYAFEPTKDWTDENLEAFGVLLQRLITELPQQAMTHSDINNILWKLAIEHKDFDSDSPPEWYVEFHKKRWVAVEALIPTEKKEKRK